MTWLIDGMNVIGSRPTGWWRDRGAAMLALVTRLGGFAAATGDQVMVVFDGRERPLDTPPGVEVRFATRSGRNAADDDIAQLAGPGVRVVTSDAALAGRARDAGADVLGAGAFLQRLDELD